MGLPRQKRDKGSQVRKFPGVRDTGELLKDLIAPVNAAIRRFRPEQVRQHHQAWPWRLDVSEQDGRNGFLLHR